MGKFNCAFMARSQNAYCRHRRWQLRGWQRWMERQRRRGECVTSTIFDIVVWMPCGTCEFGDFILDIRILTQNQNQFKMNTHRTVDKSTARWACKDGWMHVEQCWKMFYWYLNTVNVCRSWSKLSETFFYYYYRKTCESACATETANK